MDGTRLESRVVVGREQPEDDGAKQYYDNVAAATFFLPSFRVSNTLYSVSASNATQASEAAASVNVLNIFIPKRGELSGWVWMSRNICIKML